MPFCSTELDGVASHLLLIEKLLAFLLVEDICALFDGHALGLVRLPPMALPSMSPRLITPMLPPGIPGMSKLGIRAGLSCDFDFDLAVAHLAIAQPFAEFGPGVVGGALSDHRIEDSLLGGQLGLGCDFFAHAVADERQSPFPSDRE